MHQDLTLFAVRVLIGLSIIWLAALWIAHHVQKKMAERMDGFFFALNRVHHLTPPAIDNEWSKEEVEFWSQYFDVQHQRLEKRRRT